MGISNVRTSIIACILINNAVAPKNMRNRLAKNHVGLEPYAGLFLLQIYEIFTTVMHTTNQRREVYAEVLGVTC